MISPFFSPNIGGVETHLDDLCDYLRKRDHMVFVITYQPLTTNVKAPKFERGQNLEIRRIGWFGYNLFHKLEPYPLLEFVYLAPMLFGYSLFFFFRYRNEVDVIHAHGLNAAFAAKVLAWLFRKRTVASIHAIYDLPKRPMLARLMRVTLFSFDVVLTLAIKSKIELMGIGLDSRRIRVFTYWVDQNVFRPMNKEECKKELAFEDKFVVLFVGRLLGIKGVKVLIEVARRFAGLKDVLFMFVGDGPLADEVRTASDGSGNIIYVGKIENRQLSVYYNVADVVVVPSLYEEGFGRVVLEAISCGTPAIASNRGGIPEALDPSVGVLIEPTVYDIERTVKYFYGNSSELLKLAVNCREYAEERFSQKNGRIIEESYSRYHESPNCISALPSVVMSSPLEHDLMVLPLIDGVRGRGEVIKSRKFSLVQISFFHS